MTHLIPKLKLLHLKHFLQFQHSAERATHVSFQDQVGYDRLVTAGLVRSGGVVQSICCEACEDLHDAAVVFEDGYYGHYCDQAGFVKLAEDNLMTIQPNIGNLIGYLADVFDCKRRKNSPIHNERWRGSDDRR